MSTPPVPRKVHLPPEALAALEKDGAVKFKKPLSVKTLNVIRKWVAKTLYGLSMKPTIRQQLLGFPSYRAIAAVWAADWWRLKMKEKYR